MNQGEAERCIELGLSALKKGDKDKAIRLFQKSLNLYPTEEARKYIKIASETKEVPQAKESPPSSSSLPKPSAQYTREQEQLCREIMSKTNYYEILGCEKSATQDQLKKSYRKLALKLHPDKNQAPSSSEAFKKINKAFACLSDETKRRTYDQTGQEEVHGIEMNNFSGFEGGDFAEHIFREFFNESFFFPGQGFHRVYRTHNHQNHQQQRHETDQQGRNRVPLLQLLPFFILLLFSFLSNYQGSSEMYSFHYSSVYSVKKTTENYNVEYYLQPSVAKDLTLSERQKIEKNVEQTYYAYLSQECDQQKRKKNSLMNKAKYYKGTTGQTYRDYAEQVDMTACINLQEFQTR